MRCAGSALRRRVLQSDKNLDPKEEQVPPSSRARVTHVAPAIEFQRFIFTVRSTLAAIWGISLIR
jgi:hypothetical protein